LDQGRGNLDRPIPPDHPTRQRQAMGSGASAKCIATVTAASEQELHMFVDAMPESSRTRLTEALAASSLPSVGADATAASDSASTAGHGGNAAAAVTGTHGAGDGIGGGGCDVGGADDIPTEWGWPAEPHDASFLRQYVLAYTKASQQEEWDKALQARSVGGSFEDHLAEKAFVNLLLNKEGTGEEKEGQAHKGIDINAYEKGKWYRFLNAKGDCNVYIHNYTCDVTATKPDSFTEMTPEEKDRLKKLGVYIKDLPDHMAKVYDKQQQIPIVFGSKDCCEALKTFAEYAKEWQLLDVTKLRRVNEKALEESRRAIVNAMKWGKWLMVYLGDHIPELGEKICTTKNRDKFPIGLWQHGGLNNGMVKEKIYREDDKEGGMYVVREGFRVCVVLMYDSLVYEHSSMRKDDMNTKIPNFHYMEQMRCFTDQDIKKILAASG